MKEIIYYLFLIGESLTAVETDKKNKGCGIPRAIEPRPYFSPLHPPPPPQAFSPFFLPLFPVSYTISPFIFSPFRQIKRALSEQKAGLSPFHCILCLRRRRRRKKTAFSEQFSRKISAAFVCANIFGRGLQYIPPQKWPLYIGGSGAEKQREALKFFGSKKKTPQLFFAQRRACQHVVQSTPLSHTIPTTAAAAAAVAIKIPSNRS